MTLYSGTYEERSSIEFACSMYFWGKSNHYILNKGTTAANWN